MATVRQQITYLSSISRWGKGNQTLSSLSGLHNSRGLDCTKRLIYQENKDTTPTNTRLVRYIEIRAYQKI